MPDETTVGREPVVIAELEQDQCRLIYGDRPCNAVLGSTGVRKCYNTRVTCQDPDNYDSSPGVVDSSTAARSAVSQATGDIDFARQVEASFSVNTEESAATDLFFSRDGSFLYVIGTSSDSVHQYPLSTPFDIATAGTVKSSFSVASEELTPRGFFFKPDGLKLYVVGDTSQQVRQYSLTRPWDVSTAGAVEASFSVSGEDTSPQAIHFKSDGTKLYVLGTSTDTVYQYPVSTAWDISTAGTTDASFSVTTEETSPSGMEFSSDGLRLYVCGGASDDVHQYPLSTAWDLSTAGSVEVSFDVSGEEGTASGVRLHPFGSRFYIVGGTSNQAHQYPIDETWNVDLCSTVQKSFSVAGEETTPSGMFFKSDGTKLYVVGSTSNLIHRYPLSTAWELSTAGSVDQSFDVSGEETTPRGIFFKPDGLKLYVVGSDSDDVHEYPLSTAWDLSSVGAVASSFSLAGEDTIPTDIFFKSDGTKLYVIGESSDTVHQYPLSTAWDLSTAGTVEASKSVSTEETIPRGLFFRDDGTNMYIVGVSDNVHQYPLSTAWDLSTAGSSEASFSVASEEGAASSLSFSSDGYHLYVLGTDSDSVHEYAIAHGTIDGALHVAAHTFGFGQALRFDGVDDSVRVPDPLDRFGFAGTLSFTVEFHLNANSIPQSTTHIVRKVFTDGGGTQGWEIFLRQSSQTIEFRRYRDGSSTTVTAGVVFGEGALWSAVYDGTDIILYKDGIEKARDASSESMLQNAQGLMIGNSAVGGSDPIDADLDDIRIWKLARTQAEIRERLDLPISGREVGVVGYWPFDTNPPGVATRTLRFAEPQSNLSRSLYMIPLLRGVQTASTRINPGGGSRDRGVLGDRSTVNVSFRDAPHTDRVVDKYRDQRIDGTAQTDEAGYDPLARGTFWSKWRARNQYFQNRRIRILEGYIGQSLSAMQRREYFVDTLSGPNANGQVSIRAKDVLKLADDERAQAPVATSGELTADLAVATTTNFQATGALVADYPDEPGYVRINDEVIQYTTRTQATADNVQFNTLTRGAKGTTADDHDAEDRVQNCVEFVNQLPWKVVRSLLVDYGNVPAEFIPDADWDAEGDVWLQQFTVSSLITEPTSVTELISEITQQTQFFVWWDEHTQEIRLKALRPPTEEPVDLDDDAHVIAGSSVLSEDAEQRISQVWVFFKQRVPTEDLDDEANYSRLRIRADLAAETAEQYGEPRIKKIFSRWIETEAQVIQVAKRTLDRFRDNARMLKLKIDAKDRSTLRVGDVADVLNRTVVDDRGLPVETRWQVISSRENPPGEAVDLEMLLFEFTGRFSYYMETTAPQFSAATEEEKKSGAWYADDNGKMPDGTDGFQLQ